MNLYGETFSGLYDRRFSDYALKAAPLLLKWFSSRSAAKSRPSILDLGCGTGQLAQLFLEAGYATTGLDLSPHMLERARARCRRFLPEGRARFLEADFSSFRVEGPFGLVLSTYNSLNHLDSAEKTQSCFRSVRESAAEEGLFLFDYHTRLGLRDWASSESGQWEADRVEIQGEYDEGKGRALMRIRGEVEGIPFEETIGNRSFPLSEVEEWLNQEGFNQVFFCSLTDLGTPLVRPEEEKRVVVIAR